MRAITGDIRTLAILSRRGMNWRALGTRLPSGEPFKFGAELERDKSAKVRAPTAHQGSSVGVASTVLTAAASARQVVEGYCVYITLPKRRSDRHFPRHQSNGNPTVHGRESFVERQAHLPLEHLAR